MAQVNVERREQPGTPAWVWIVGAVILAAIIWWAVAGRSGSGAGSANYGAETTTGPNTGAPGTAGGPPGAPAGAGDTRSMAAPGGTSATSENPMGQRAGSPGTSDDTAGSSGANGRAGSGQ